MVGVLAPADATVLANGSTVSVVTDYTFGDSIFFIGVRSSELHKESPP